MDRLGIRLTGVDVIDQVSLSVIDHVIHGVVGICCVTQTP